MPTFEQSFVFLRLVVTHHFIIRLRLCRGRYFSSLCIDVAIQLSKLSAHIRLSQWRICYLRWPQCAWPRHRLPGPFLITNAYRSLPHNSNFFESDQNFTMSTLFALPEILFVEILSNWICEKDLTGFDSACCNKKSRSEYLTVIRCTQFIVPGETIPDKQNYLRWISIRGVKMSRFCFSSSPETFPEN